MMRQPNRRPRVRDTVLLGGWLFADLLLGLAVIFLAANTIGVKIIPTPTPTPTPTATPSPTPTPKPTVLPRLELSAHEFTINIADRNALLSNSQDAVNQVIHQVKAQPFLQGRNVGLVIAYGWATDDSQIATAQAIANKIYSILGNLGQRGDPLFNRASFYKPLYVLGTPNNNSAVIDVYLFAS